MSQEAEKAAKWQLMEDYNGAKAKLAILEGKVKEAGANLLDAGRILQNIHHGITFQFGQHDITMYNESSSRGQNLVGEIQLQGLEPESLTRLLRDFQETRGKVSELKDRLKQVGVDFTSFQ